MSVTYSGVWKSQNFSTCPRISKLQNSTWPSLNLTCPNFTANHLLIVYLVNNQMLICIAVALLI